MCLALLASALATTRCAAAPAVGARSADNNEVAVRIVQGRGLAPRILAAEATRTGTTTAVTVELGWFKHVPLGPKVLLIVSLLAPDGSVKFGTTQEIRTFNTSRAHPARTRVSVTVPSIVTNDEVVKILVTTSMPGSMRYSIPGQAYVEAH